MTQPFVEVPTMVYFEDILPHTGWGLYYNFMMMMACISSFTQGTAFLAFPVAIALSSCEHPVSNLLLFSLHTSSILGRAFGGLFLNTLCDIYGRKRLLTHSMVLIFLSSFMAAFAYNYYVIIFAAFILASGLEVNHCVVRVHLAEVLPSNRRGFYLSFCDLFWSFGYIFISLLGIFLRDPLLVDANVADMRLAYWRLVFAIAGGLNIIMACATALLEESPRYFLHIKKYYLAVLTLKQFYAINKSSYGEYLEVKEQDMVNIVNGENPSIYPEPNGCIAVWKKVIKLSFSTINLVFSKKHLGTTMILLAIKIPLLIFSHFNLNVMMAKNSLNHSYVREGIEVVHLDHLKNFTLCNSMEGNEMYYIYFTLTSGIIVGILSVICFVDYLGRKSLSCTSLILCGACYVTIFYVENTTSKIILSTVLMASFSAVTTTASIINIESYPTALRCTSWGVLNIPGLLIGIFIIKYYHLIANYFFLIHPLLFSGAAVAAYFLHDLKRKPMVE